MRKSWVFARIRDGHFADEPQAGALSPGNGTNLRCETYDEQPERRASVDDINIMPFTTLLSAQFKFPSHGIRPPQFPS